MRFAAVVACHHLTAIALVTTVRCPVMTLPTDKTDLEILEEMVDSGGS